ncbi:MAG: divergent PAP2 family protein [Christensenellaceae bacterium]|nr:divergent PAP2 family protein [Christensenellaceae bacterium]
MSGSNFLAMFQNAILLPAGIGWFSAQLLKGVLILALHRRIDWARFTGTGGMPSSHTAFVVGAAASLGLHYGWNSPLFALGAVLAIIVMYDAAGVRRAAGRHAARINQIIERMTASGNFELKPEELKELLGHTPLEILAGALLGVLIAVACS